MVVTSLFERCAGHLRTFIIDQTASENISPISLSFRGEYREYESDFFAEFNKKTVFGIRRTLLLFMLLYPAFLIIDMMLMPGNFSWFLKIRTLAVFPPGLAFIALSFIPAVRKHPSPLAVIASTYCAAMCMLVLYRTPVITQQLYTAGIMLIFIGIHIGLYLRYIVATTITFILLALFVVTGIFFIGMALPLVMFYAFMLFGSIVFAMIASYMTEYHLRREFIARQIMAMKNTEIAAVNDTLEERIQVRTRELKESHGRLLTSRHMTIFGLAKIAESRDHCTGQHLERIREYSILLAAWLKEHTAYKGYITDEYIQDIYESSILHDIGKVAIPDAILLKPGKLDAAEFEAIKKHTVIGGDALKEINDTIGYQSFLALAIEIAYSHHERWDGKGYPKGLAGDAIGISARIVALADVYDALTTERPYKKPWSHAAAAEYCINERGKQFDPDVCDAFKALENEFYKVQRQLSDLVP